LLSILGLLRFATARQSNRQASAAKLSG